MTEHHPWIERVPLDEPERCESCGEVEADFAFVLGVLDSARTQPEFSICEMCAITLWKVMRNSYNLRKGGSRRGEANNG